MQPSVFAFLWSYLTSCRLVGIFTLALGGDERVRTDDPLLAKQVLSQLSYTPILKGVPFFSF